MLKKILSSFILISFLSLPTFAAGQQLPSGKWWYGPKVKDRIKLTDEEKSRLEAQFLESRHARIELRSAVEKERLELENLMGKEKLNERSVMEQAEKLQKARSNLAMERFNVVLQARIIIGYDKFRELKTIFGKRWWQKKHAKEKQGPGKGK